MARRASEVALACENVPAARKSSDRWRTLAPSDREAAAMYATIAIKLYRIADARAGILAFEKADGPATPAGTPASQDSRDAGLSELAGLLLEQADPPAVLAAWNMLSGKISQPVKTRSSRLARGTKSLIKGLLPSVRLPRRMVPIWVSEPIGFARPLRTASMPATSVVATAPIPTIMIPSFPFAG